MGRAFSRYYSSPSRRLANDHQRRLWLGTELTCVISVDDVSIILVYADRFHEHAFVLNGFAYVLLIQIFSSRRRVIF